jgi:phosphatidylglycerophosphatase A
MKSFTQSLLSVIATWFYVGKMKKAPGTWATLATVPLVFALNHLGPIYNMAAIFMLMLIGIIAADFYEKKSSVHDNSEIVIDEVVGFLITMVWLPNTWQAYLLGFIFFRVLDIFKPFPISYLDRKVKGGMGIMIDDIAAGMIANVALQQLYTHTSILGSQLVHITN